MRHREEKWDEDSEQLNGAPGWGTGGLETLGSCTVTGLEKQLRTFHLGLWCSHRT